MKQIPFFGPRPVRPLKAFGSKEFYQSLNEGSLRGQRCANCSASSLPPTLACPSCGGQKFEPLDLTTHGVLFAFTMIHSAPGALSRQSPYHIALVDLPNNVRVQCRLFGRSGQKFEPGMAISMFVASYEDGPILAAHPAGLAEGDLHFERTQHMSESVGVPSAFRALVADKQEGKYETAFRTLSAADLPDEDVVVKVEMTGLNYKDALAISGKAPIVRKFPMVLGIDLAGTIVRSRTPRFQPGQKVLVTGFGLSETRWGGFSEYQSLPEQIVMPLPPSFSFEEAMLIGTAGYTAMLSVMALIDHGLRPVDGPILVTGATGGVGSVALMLLSRRGYCTVAVTGRPEQGDFLRSLGATDVVSRDDVASSGKPLERERWAGAVEVVGGKMLADTIAQTKYGGIVACCGMAASGDLPVSVYPFILRGVTLKGVDSVMLPMQRRKEAWNRLEAELDRQVLGQLGSIRRFDELPQLAQDLLSGKLRGRIAVSI